VFSSYKQTRGHNVASLDPLGIADADLDSETPQELLQSTYGLGRYSHDRLAYSSLDDFKDRHLTEFLQIIDR